MPHAELQRNEEASIEVGFDYGASGRGGWDEPKAGLVQDRKRVKGKRVTPDADSHILRAEVQGRCAADLRKAKPDEWTEPEGIYLILNVVSRDTYVGQSERILSRWRMHLSQSNIGKHSIERMNELAKLYGLDSFRFVMLQRTNCGIFGLKRHTLERRWIRKLKPTLNKTRVRTK